MKVELFSFQKTALARLRQSVATALCNYRSTHTPKVVSYTAPTEAGKTIVMSALIEAIYYGDELYPDQNEAIFIWLSDSPQLNEQSRLKIDLKANKIQLNQCVTISDNAFDMEMLEDGQTAQPSQPTLPIQPSQPTTQHSSTEAPTDEPTPPVSDIDVVKRTVALENKLRYLEIFDMSLSKDKLLHSIKEYVHDNF